MKHQIYEALFEYIQSLEIIDTHEHLAAFEHQRPKTDVLQEYLLHYFNRDLVSAGLSQAGLRKVLDSNLLGAPPQHLFSFRVAVFQVSEAI